ncbi:MAG TPA: sulfurtransferase-like selenium metabolism protein YedF [Thermoguttaceae bacterium]
MTEKRIDARGLACPQPVVLARQVILQGDVQSIIVEVDDEINVENIRRMARTEGWNAAVEKTGLGFKVQLTKGLPADVQPSAAPGQSSRTATNLVVYVASNLLGVGEEELGRILMRAFLKTLQDVAPLPSTMIFINSGVRLTTVGSDLIDELRNLETLGVRIISCGTCLDYYRLKDSLQVGAVTNMFEIASTLLNADRVVRF